jgi:ATP/maltotriose-dependent transcriptional regulator MalT
VALERGDLASIRLHHAAAGAIVARVPDSSLRWNHAYHNVWIAVLAGDLIAAEQLLQESLEVSLAAGGPDAFAIYTAQLVNVYNQRRRMHGVVGGIAAAITANPGLEVYRAVIAQAHAVNGAVAPAIELMDEAITTGSHLRHDATWLAAVTSWAEAAVRTGHLGVARQTRDLMEPSSDHLTTTMITVSPCLAHHLGMVEHFLGDLEAADRWHRRANAVHEALESPPLVSATKARWALLLIDQGRDDDRERARNLAEEALAAADAGGYRLVEHDARAALEHLDRDPGTGHAPP